MRTDGLICAAIVLDTWSRRVGGSAIGRTVDARLTRAARGDPSYDNAEAKSFMKTLRVRPVNPMAFASFDDVAEHHHQFIDGIVSNDTATGSESRPHERSDPQCDRMPLIKRPDR